MIRPTPSETRERRVPTAKSAAVGVRAVPAPSRRGPTFGRSRGPRPRSLLWPLGNEVPLRPRPDRVLRRQILGDETAGNDIPREIRPTAPRPSQSDVRVRMRALATRTTRSSDQMRGGARPRTIANAEGLRLRPPEPAVSDEVDADLARLEEGSLAWHRPLRRRRLTIGVSASVPGSVAPARGPHDRAVPIGRGTIRVPPAGGVGWLPRGLAPRLGWGSPRNSPSVSDNTTPGSRQAGAVADPGRPEAGGPRPPSATPPATLGRKEAADAGTPPLQGREPRVHDCPSESTPSGPARYRPTQCRPTQCRPAQCRPARYRPAPGERAGRRGAAGVTVPVATLPVTAPGPDPGPERDRALSAPHRRPPPSDPPDLRRSRSDGPGRQPAKEGRARSGARTPLRGDCR